MFEVNLPEPLLLLSCCAPCSCAVIQHLSKIGINFTVIFYNPNIRPFEEYERRRQENEKLCKKFSVPFVSLEYDNERWCEKTKGLLSEPERGKRCDICFEMRLRKVAKYAQEHGFKAVSSVLGVSKYKDFDQVNRAANRAFEKSSVSYFPVNWRKGGLEQIRQTMQKELQLYRQTYCGCQPRSTII